MNILARGCVSKVYLEVNQSEQRIDRIVLCIGDSNWIELVDVQTANEGFVLPAPLGCECVVTDISDRQWAHAKYEVEFASSYSRDGAFFAKGFSEVAGI